MKFLPWLRLLGLSAVFGYAPTVAWSSAGMVQSPASCLALENERMKLPIPVFITFFYASSVF